MPRPSSTKSRPSTSQLMTCLPLDIFWMSISRISNSIACTEAVLTSEGQLSGPHRLSRKFPLLNSRESDQSMTSFPLALTPSLTKPQSTERGRVRGLLKGQKVLL